PPLAGCIRPKTARKAAGRPLDRDRLTVHARRRARVETKERCGQVLSPAARATARAAEPRAIAEDEAAVLAARRLDAEPCPGAPHRARDVLQVGHDLLLGDVRQR